MNEDEIYKAYGYDVDVKTYKEHLFNVVPLHKRLEDHETKLSQQLQDLLNEEKARKMVNEQGLDLKATKKFYIEKIKEYNEILNLSHLTNPAPQQKVAPKKFIGNPQHITNYDFVRNWRNLNLVFNQLQEKKKVESRRSSLVIERQRRKSQRASSNNRSTSFRKEKDVLPKLENKLNQIFQNKNDQNKKFIQIKTRLEEKQMMEPIFDLKKSQLLFSQVNSPLLNEFREKRAQRDYLREQSTTIDTYNNQLTQLNKSLNSLMQNDFQNLSKSVEISRECDQKEKERKQLIQKMIKQNFNNYSENHRINKYISEESQQINTSLESQQNDQLEQRIDTLQQNQSYQYLMNKRHLNTLNNSGNQTLINIIQRQQEEVIVNDKKSTQQITTPINKVKILKTRNMDHKNTQIKDKRSMSVNKYIKEQNIISQDIDRINKIQKSNNQIKFQKSKYFVSIDNERSKSIKKVRFQNQQSEILIEDVSTTDRLIQLESKNKFEQIEIPQESFIDQILLEDTLEISKDQAAGNDEEKLEYVDPYFQHIQQLYLEEKKQKYQYRLKVIKDLRMKREPKFIHFAGSKIAVKNDEANLDNYRINRQTTLKKALDLEIDKLKDRNQDDYDLETLAGPPPQKIKHESTSLRQDYDDVKVTKILKQCADLIK